MNNLDMSVVLQKYSILNARRATGQELNEKELAFVSYMQNSFFNAKMNDVESVKAEIVLTMYNNLIK
jgi:hypothetical protein